MIRVLEHVGRVLLGGVDSAGRSVLLLLRTLATLGLVHRVLRATVRQVDQAGFGSIMVLSLIAALTGMIMVMQIAPTLETYNALPTLGGIIGATFARELGPIWAAVIVLARVGSAMAAELGTMAVNEEVEALKVMSIDPVRYLVLPRILALLLCLPLLTIIADVVGIAGGAFVAEQSFGQPMATFMDSARDFLNWQAVWSGLIKSFFFGAIIGTIACTQGLRTEGGAEGVGHATTATVRLCVIFVLVADLILTRALALILPGSADFGI
jgi:phospholipid/cholesterol/gamma-HCH transport system permease protein